MSLRLKLLLLGLLTLVLPWAGCRYAREMESALREGEQNSLQSFAQNIAASLQGRTDLLYRAAPEAAPPDSASAATDSAAPAADASADATAAADATSAATTSTASTASTASTQGSPATAPAADPEPPRPGPYDLQPLILTAAPLLDGYLEDWPKAPAAWKYFGTDAHHRFGILTGVYERMLYAVIEVHDEHPVFDAPGTNVLDPAIFGDRVWLAFEDPQGVQHQVFLAATGPGAVSARRIETGEYGQRSAPIEPRIRGAWQSTSQGYRIELRIPLSMAARGFGVLVDDRDRRGAEPVSYGMLRSDDLHTLGQLIVASPELGPYLTQFLRPGLKASVSSPDGQLLARADALATSGTLEAESPLLARLYRRFVDRPGERTLI